MAGLLSVARVVFVGILTFLFIKFFGIPALQRYLEGGVLLKVSTVSNPSGGLLPPTITICPGERYEVGWKNSSGELVNLIRAECENFDDNKAILNCVGNKTYNFTDTVKMAFVGSVNPKNLMNQIYWSKYMAVTAYGN